MFSCRGLTGHYQTRETSCSSFAWLSVFSMSIISGVIWCGQIKPQRPRLCVCAHFEDWSVWAFLLRGAGGGARWYGSGLVYLAVALWPHVIRGPCEARCRADPATELYSAYSEPLYRALLRDKGRVSQNHSLITTQSFISIKARSGGGKEVLAKSKLPHRAFSSDFGMCL